MKDLPRAPGQPAHIAHPFAFLAKFGLAAVLTSLALAIVVGGPGLGRDGTIGRLSSPTLGNLTRPGGICAILAMVAGALLGWHMAVQLFIEG